MSETMINPQQEENDDVLQRFFSRGGSLRMLTDIDDQDLVQLYSYAGQLFAAGEFVASRNFYQLLSTFDHWNYDYLLGLGLSHQRLSAHEEAISCFARAGMITIDDPRAAFFAGLSYRLVGNEAYARKAFNAAIMWCGEQSHYQEIKGNAERMLTATTEEVPCTLV